MVPVLYSQVLNEGTIALVNARHPVLLLRGKNPVGNDMSLDGDMQALVLTGPNAGKRRIFYFISRQKKMIQVMVVLGQFLSRGVPVFVELCRCSRCSRPTLVAARVSWNRLRCQKRKSVRYAVFSRLKSHTEI